MVVWDSWASMRRPPGSPSRARSLPLAGSGVVPSGSKAVDVSASVRGGSAAAGVLLQLHVLERFRSASLFDGRFADCTHDCAATTECTESMDLSRGRHGDLRQSLCD